MRATGTHAYPSFDCVDDISPALLALCGIDNQNGQLGVLVEHLLHATIVATGLGPRHKLALGAGILVLVALGICGLMPDSFIACGRRCIGCVVSRIYRHPVGVSMLVGRIIIEWDGVELGIVHHFGSARS
jgi:hypothetical protein